MLEFNEDDLQANRRGQLSPRQREWLKGVGAGGVRMQAGNIGIAVFFMFLGLCIILALYLSNEDARAALFSNPVNLLAFPIIVLIVLGVYALSVLLARWNAHKLDQAVLSSVSGTVRFDEESSGNSGITTYFVIVGRKKFKFAEEMSNVFKEGEEYKVYYCKAGMYEFVMSYEQLYGS